MSSNPRSPDPPDSPSPRPKVSCSFCGKSEDAVRRLTAGPNVHICDECVDLCNDVLERESAKEVTAKSETPTSAVASCALCHLPKDATELRMIGENGALCVACIEMVRSVVESI